MGKNPKKPTALPLYLQLSEFLIREIAVGHLIDGDRLPPEREMAIQYGTTVTTLRKALAILCEKNLLERLHGSGNYIRHAAKVDSVYSMFRLELCEGGGLPTAKTFSVVEQQKPSSLPEFGTSQRATQIRRLRFLDTTPIAVEDVWLDRDSGLVVEAQLQESLYRYYQKELGFWITRAEDRVGLDQCPSWAPAEFGVPQGALTGFVERFSWAQNTKPVEFSRTWFDASKCNYVQRL